VNKNRNINKKVLNKFLNLMDKDVDIKACLSEFPGNHETLGHYAGIIKGLGNLKKISASGDVEEKSLKDVYLQARIENVEGQKKGFKRDMFLARLRPAFLKPLIIFLGVFIFISFSFAGTIYASTDSLPGEMLYTVKRASESIQVTLTPYRYEGNIYLKMLDSRLREADVILSLGDFTDTVALEKLAADIDDVYERCRNRNYLDLNKDMQMQTRIRAVKEGFKKRYGMNKNGANDFSGQDMEDTEDTANSGTGMQGFEQDDSGKNNNSEENDNNSPDDGEQNQKGKQNQYGK